MSVDRISLDANILFYAIDVDAGERHERANLVTDPFVVAGEQPAKDA